MKRRNYVLTISMEMDGCHDSWTAILIDLFALLVLSQMILWSSLKSYSGSSARWQLYQYPFSAAHVPGDNNNTTVTVWYMNQVTSLPLPSQCGTGARKSRPPCTPSRVHNPGTLGKRYCPHCWPPILQDSVLDWHIAPPQGFDAILSMH